MKKHDFRVTFIVLALLFIISACSQSNEEIINDAVTELKPSLPRKANDQVTWVDVEAGQDELIYIYEIRGIDQSQLDIEAMVPKLKSVMIPLLKKEKSMERTFKRNIRLKYIYKNEVGEELLSFNISREDMGY
jgi:hypothetical protein